MFYLIKVGTVTNAQRVRNALKYRGIKANVTRLSNPAPSDGCGYAVQVEKENLQTALRIAESENIFVRGVEAL